MKPALALSEAKTIQRYEQRHKAREKRGYHCTEQFVAACNAIETTRLAKHLCDCLEERDEHGLRLVPYGNIAVAGLSPLLHGIASRDLDPENSQYQEPGLSIEVGLWIQGEVWAAGESAGTRKWIWKSKGSFQRSARAKRAGYRKENWTEERRLQVGNWFYNRCLEALPDVFERIGFYRRHGGRTVRSYSIDIREEARQKIFALSRQLMLASPVILPRRKSSNLGPAYEVVDSGTSAIQLLPDL
jgi:hypothetical protein